MPAALHHQPWRLNIQRRPSRTPGATLDCLRELIEIASQYLVQIGNELPFPGNRENFSFRRDKLPHHCTRRIVQIVDCILLTSLNLQSRPHVSLVILNRAHVAAQRSHGDGRRKKGCGNHRQRQKNLPKCEFQTSSLPARMKSGSLRMIDTKDTRRAQFID